MKAQILAAAVLFGTSGIAIAADPGLPMDSPPIAHDWSGFYVGGHVGYGGADLDGSYDDDDFDNLDFLTDGGGPFDLEPDGILGGIQLGYNWQSGSFVYGIEGDIAFTDWSDSLTQSEADVNVPERVSVETNYVATLRARAGYAWDRALVFGTVGAAITDTKFTANDDVMDPDPDEIGSIKLDNVGVVVGGGVEYALNEQWSVKAEGLYFWFNDDHSTYDLTNDQDEGNFIDFRNAWALRVGVNYHF